MRRCIVLFVAIFAVINLAMTDAYAQSVNIDKIVAKFNKLDAAVNNPKKSGDAELWMEHARASVEAAKCITETIGMGLSFDVAYLSLGNYQKREAAQLSDRNITIYKYPFIDIYVASDNSIVGWQSKSVVAGKDLYRVAMNSLSKAYKLNPAMKSMIANELATISRHCVMNADANFMIEAYAEAARDYMMAYEAQNEPAYNGSKDYEYLFNAAYLLTMSVNTPEARRVAMSAFQELISEGYEKNGDVYYYLVNCYIAGNDSSVEAAKVAYDGIVKYPGNEPLCEVASSIFTKQKFSSTDYEKYAKAIDRALQTHTRNYNLWSIRGYICYNLSRFDDAIASYKKCVEILPNDALMWFYVGFAYIAKGEYERNELMKILDVGEKYSATQKRMDDSYRESLQYFEKAHSLDPQNKAILENLKVVAFYFRNEPGMMEKYEKYKALYER